MYLLITVLTKCNHPQHTYSKKIDFVIKRFTPDFLPNKISQKNTKYRTSKKLVQNITFFLRSVELLQVNVHKFLGIIFSPEKKCAHLINIWVKSPFDSAPDGFWKNVAKYK